MRKISRLAKSQGRQRCYLSITEKQGGYQERVTRNEKEPAKLNRTQPLQPLYLHPPFDQLGKCLRPQAYAEPAQTLFFFSPITIPPPLITTTTNQYTMDDTPPEPFSFFHTPKVIVQELNRVRGREEGDRRRRRKRKVL